MSSPRRILAFLPLPYEGGEQYWKRETGLLVMTLRQQGEDAKLVMYPGSAEVPPDVPLIIATKEEVLSPAWWKEQAPWAVVLHTWGAPRFTPLWQAIRQATPRMIERLDTDGNRSPRIDWPLYLYAMWSRIHDFPEKRWRRWFASITPFVHLVYNTLFPARLDRRMAAGISALPIVGAESPIAVARIQRYLQSYNLPAENIHCFPHPVEESELPALTDLSKEKTVISIGRWDAHQKNFPLQLRVLEEFLKAHADWSAVLIGPMPAGGKELIARLCPSTGSRVAALGPQSHQKIYEELKRARIFLMSSRHESFNNAAAEALCCGCSVVGPSHIASVPWFCGASSGTVAPLYTKNGLLDGLNTEVHAWASDQRHPTEMATLWRPRVGATPMVRRMLHLFEGISS